MLFAATLLAVVIGTAVSAPWYAGSSRHQMDLNPLWQGRSSLTQGFLCDWCVVGVEDAQLAIRENFDKILGVLNRTSTLCQYCPVEDSCIDYFLNEIPQEIQNFLGEAPDAICSEAGICEENATLPGMVMSGLNPHVARDRVVKRMLMRARIMQQKMIRLILGDDYLCTACQDFITIAKDILLDNETQYEIVDFLTPLCDYLPTEYQTDCDEFVQSLPALMTMLADEVLVDSTCTELGFCGQTKTTEEPGFPNIDTDIFSQLGIPGILPALGINGQKPFQFPGQQNPFGGNPFGSPSRADQNPFGLPSRPGQNPFGIPSLPGQTSFGAPYSRPGQSRPHQNPFQFPSRSRPQVPIGKWPTSADKVWKPKPKPTPIPNDRQIPDFNLNVDDIFGENTGMAGVLDQLPAVPEIPKVRIPHHRLPINIPGAQSWRRQQRRLRSVPRPDWNDEKFNRIVPKERVMEYIPDPIPVGGFTITQQGADENCEVCKVAVTAVDTWLQENAPQLQKMISQMVEPFCQAFPSPMKEDCVTDVAEFVSTFIQTLVSKLQPDPVCTWLGVCGAKDETPETPTFFPHVPTTKQGKKVEPTPTPWPFWP